MASEMVLLCEIWKQSAVEYMMFLRRYGIECFAIGNKFKETMQIYVDQEKYLSVSFEQPTFNDHEKQLLYLLKTLEMTVERCVELESDLLEQVEDYEYENEDDEY